MHDFLFYAFNRRFGWSEMGKHTYFRSAGGGNGGMMLMNDKSTSLQQNSVWKSQLNELLDEILHGLQKQDVSNALLHSLKQTMLRAAEKPVVRNQTLIHILEWLKRKILVTPIFELCFPVVKEIFVAGLTDVWSAIRSATASRLVPILQHLSLNEYRQFFLELVNVCKKNEKKKGKDEYSSTSSSTCSSSSSTWQSKEGAIIGIHVMIKAFAWVKREGNYGLCLGRQFLPQMPSFIVDGLTEIGESLMRHPQMSIREHAVKCFATLAMRSHFSERLRAFESVLTQLAALLEVEDADERAEVGDGGRGRGRAGGGSGKNNKRPSYSAESAKKEKAEYEPIKNNFAPLNLHTTRFMFKKSEKQNSAFAAESLLGVLLSYIKVTHPSILLPNWPMHFSVIAPYLGHPASTVRQAASLIFKVKFVCILIKWLHVTPLTKLGELGLELVHNCVFDV